MAVELSADVLRSALAGRIWEHRTLTEGGRTLAIAILRARATGPRHAFW